MIREVRRIGDPILRKKSVKVEKINRDVLKLIDDMIETMRAHQGIGLAAPQVGVAQRVAVVEIDRADDQPGSGVLYALINPEIVKKAEEKVAGQEGCLSIPGWRGEVERPATIVVKATDREGNRIKFEAEGWLARALQHEIDHLDGVLFIDKLIAPDRIWQIDESRTRTKAE